MPDKHQLPITNMPDKHPSTHTPGPLILHRSSLKVTECLISIGTTKGYKHTTSRGTNTLPDTLLRVWTNAPWPMLNNRSFKENMGQPQTHPPPHCSPREPLKTTKTSHKMLLIHDQYQTTSHYPLLHMTLGGWILLQKQGRGQRKKQGTVSLGF